jgi:predicted NACHT family NTPase
MTQKRKRSYQVKAEARQLIDTKMREKGCSSYEKLAEKTELTTKTIRKFLDPRKGRLQVKTIQKVASFLDLKEKEIVEGWYPPGSTSEVEESVSEEAVIKLCDRCREMLEQQKRLTTNRIMARNGVTFDLDEVFVDLQIEDSKGNKTNQDNSSNIFEFEDFLENIIGNKQSPKSQGKRLAILGEPGSGKTTLLLKTADWLLENTEYMPIFISLAEVGKKSLDKYLLEDWLKRAEQKIESASSEWKQALQQLLNSGKVYLLLDGADEMAKADGLYQITNQLKGWADNLRVALTCRVNFWHDNAVGVFDVYWTRKFGEKQLEEFVQKWFLNNKELGD